jgi:DNA-binding CsgD family transcriptional regulator
MTENVKTPSVKAPARERVKELIEMGLRPRQVALALGISIQRVHQHITKLRELGELPPKEEP